MTTPEYPPAAPPPAQGYPPAPPAQGYPPAYPGGYPVPQQGGALPTHQPDQVRCRFCGSTPATQVTFRQHRGIILMMQFMRQEGPFCRNCGLAAYRSMTEKTLIQGWWGLASLVITPITVLINLIRSRKVEALGPPTRDPALNAAAPPPADPGKPLYRRPAALIIPAVVLVLLGFVVVVNVLAAGSSDVGKCVRSSVAARGQVTIVDCSGAHDGKIIAEVEDPSHCPATADSYLEPEFSGDPYLCVDKDG